ncbi:MAG: N-acetyltransferase family protein [Sneathiellales bacterium]|nr:N-acetyltransferase family protein [Sneathiellales bacterium]
MSDTVIIRTVEQRDLPAIQRIYEDQVLNGVSSWEEEPPSLEEMTNRCNSILEGGFPYLVATEGDRLLGYAYASSYRARIGYRYVVENSIYVDKETRGKGVGRLLMDTLIKDCTARGFRQMIAVIGSSDNSASLDFHERMGFERVGLLPSIGFKFGRWMDSVIMQISLGDGDKTLP